MLPSIWGWFAFASRVQEESWDGRYTKPLSHAPPIIVTMYPYGYVADACYFHTLICCGGPDVQQERKLMKGKVGASASIKRSMNTTLPASLYVFILKFASPMSGAYTLCSMFALTSPMLCISFSVWMDE